MLPMALTIDDFCDDWLVRTYNPDDVFPARTLWETMLLAAGDPPDGIVWGKNRRTALMYIKKRLGLYPQRTHYIKTTNPDDYVVGGPVHCYTGVKLSAVAEAARKEPKKVKVAARLSA